MNNLLKLSLFFLIAVFALPSCNSSLSITKRRYTKGFYVHHVSKPSTPKEQQRSWAEPSNVVKVNAIEEYRRANTANESVNQKQSIVTAEAPQTSGPVENKILQAGSDPSVQLSHAIRNPVKTFKQLSSEIKSAGPAEGALSLLWILLVILLVAYIAGLLLDNFGIGWLIHILLVIILVLFILWLLRIV